MKRCPKGHYFDPAKHSLCPHCGVNLGPNTGFTMPAGRMNEQDVGVTKAVFPENPAKPSKREANRGDEGETVALFPKQAGIDPVVGWLVCVEGKDKGKDYRLHSEKNFIGRADHMDVIIKGDETISRENHAIVSYNYKKREFRVYPGESRGLVFLNDEEIVSAEILKPYDVIEMGETKLMFLPFCGENFDWHTI
ncbi:MAG TPA: FHA domain-containing protein [Chondromyces sp.]|nr:FHA domain-containing protein [Chondromyces sp.]